MGDRSGSLPGPVLVRARDPGVLGAGDRRVAGGVPAARHLHLGGRSSARLSSMDRAEIVAALSALGAALDSRGLRGEMYVVGGAAIALAYDARRSTRDIDAVFEPKAAIYEAAAEVSQALELPPGWLNDAVKGFLAGEDPHAAPVLDVPGLRCLAASAPCCSRSRFWHTAWVRTKRMCGSSPASSVSPLLQRCFRWPSRSSAIASIPRRDSLSRSCSATRRPSARSSD